MDTRYIHLGLHNMSHSTLVFFLCMDKSKMPQQNEDKRRLLPNDAVFEILTRVSMDSLPACRRVCQSWRRITYEPTFSALHCRRTGSFSGYFVQQLKHNHYSSCFVSPHSFATPPSLDFLPEPVKIESASSSRGLLFCIGQGYPERHYVCRPAARQWRTMPNPKTRYRTLRTGVVVAPTGRLVFKIVRLSDSRANCMRCEVFDSRLWSWRRCNDIMFPFYELMYEAGVSSNGALHWLTRNGKIFAFDIEKEVWKMIAPPGEFEVGLDRCRQKRLVRSEWKLCLLLVEEDSMVIWRLSNYSQEKWEKVVVTSLQAINKQTSSSIVRDLPAPGVAVMENVFELIWYELNSGKSTKVFTDFHILQAFRFESDMELCEMDSRKG